MVNGADATAGDLSVLVWCFQIPLDGGWGWARVRADESRGFLVRRREGARGLWGPVNPSGPFPTKTFRNKTSDSGCHTPFYVGGRH